MKDVLDAVAAAEERLDRTVQTMTDEQAAAPSRLPGWSRAEVVTHLACNATSNAEMVAAALRGESRPQYPGGPGQRAAEIAAGRGRAAKELLDDLRVAATQWAFVMAAVLDDQWALVVPAGVGPRPVSQRVRSRLLEVEVHHADLGLGYTFRDWPEDFAADQVERTLRSFGQRRTGAAATGRWRVGPWLLTIGDDVLVGRAAGGGAGDGAAGGGSVGGGAAGWSGGAAGGWSDGDGAVDGGSGSGSGGGGAVDGGSGGAAGGGSGGDGAVDGGVDGPPGALLAWLLGRETADSAGLAVAGDARVAGLPAAFPFP